MLDKNMAGYTHSSLLTASQFKLKHLASHAFLLPQSAYHLHRHCHEPSRRTEVLRFPPDSDSGIASLGADHQQSTHFASCSTKVSSMLKPFPVYKMAQGPSCTIVTLQLFCLVFLSSDSKEPWKVKRHYAFLPFTFLFFFFLKANRNGLNSSGMW